MKAKNNNVVRRSVFIFSVYLVSSVGMAIFLFFFFMKTSSVEVSMILDKASDYDRIQKVQLNLTDRMDSIFSYTSQLDFRSRLNYKALQNSLSEKKIRLSHDLSGISEKDCRIYKKLSSQMNIFLDTKDSIQIIAMEVDMMAENLKKCQDKVRETRRKNSDRRTN